MTVGPGGGPGSGLLPGVGAGSSLVTTSDSNLLEGQGPKDRGESDVHLQALFEHML